MYCVVLSEINKYLQNGGSVFSTVRFDSWSGQGLSVWRLHGLAVFTWVCSTIRKMYVRLISPCPGHWLGIGVGPQSLDSGWPLLLILKMGQMQEMHLIVHCTRFDCVCDKQI